MAVGLRGNYSAFNEAVGSLYGDSMLLLEGRKQPFEFDDGTFSDAARMVYEAGGFDLSQLTDPKARAVINETLRVLSTAIDSGLTHEVPETLRHALENNAFIFSGFKTFHALREVGLSMVTDKGDIKPYNDFLKDVLKINNRYNHNYLYAEYNHALGASQMAAKWHDFELDGDRYDLQYRTAGDGRVREEHAMLHGITLPPSDPFWDKYLAPNGWNCRCDAVQVRKGKYERTDPKLAMTRGDNCTDALKQRMFRYNPGKTMELFPPKHPYYKAPAKVKQTIKKMSEEEIKKKRIETLRSQLPDNLTETEKNAKALNNYEMEQALGITVGKPMTVDEADKQSANPKHVMEYIPDPKGTFVDKVGNRYKLNPDYNEKRDKPFSINCQTCAPAYALRLMGIDVTAKGNTPGSLSDYLSKQRSFEAWLNPDGSKPTPALTYDWMVNKGYRSMTEKRYREYFDECCKDEGVYILTIGWRGGGGHAAVIQRFADGTLSYIEPQEYIEKKGSQRSMDELCKGGATQPKPKRGVLRVDNKVFNKKFLSIFDKGGNDV